MQVPIKSRRVLYAQILRYIAPKSIICSDGMASYVGIKDYDFMDHYTVIHGKNFTNPANTDANFNALEIHNRWLKQGMKSCSIREAISSYYHEYTYKRKYFNN